MFSLLFVRPRGMGGGWYPSQDRDRTPAPPPPGQYQDRGTPHYPGHDTLWTGYAAGGAPLAVTQEDCLLVCMLCRLGVK